MHKFIQECSTFCPWAEVSLRGFIVRSSLILSLVSSRPWWMGKYDVTTKLTPSLLWWRGRKMKESLQLRLWNFNVCIEKVEEKFCRCKVLIGGDDISNDVISLSKCFSMFVNIRARFHFALIGENSIAQLTESPREIGGLNSNSTDVVASFPSFFRPATRPLQRA